MQQGPELELPHDMEPEGPVEALQVGKAHASRSVALLKRPVAQELEVALRAHRQDPAGIEPRRVLLLLLFRCVALQARDLVTGQLRALAHREDELVLRTLARIEGGQLIEGDLEQESAVGPQLLADYEFRATGRAIYTYVAQKTINIARNMQAEAYVPDGGFWSKDLVARFKALSAQEAPGHHARRGGVQIEMTIDCYDDEEDGHTDSGPLPAGLRMSETPLRQSVLRINSLARKLDALGRDMVGKTIALTQDKDAAAAETRLTVNHQRIWRAWLGLSHPELIDLGEEELAVALGVSKATVTRDTSAAFAFMLGQPDLRVVLALMAPNRFQNSAVNTRELDAQLEELESTLRGPSGKRFFRKCVHKWLGEHV